MKWLGLGMGALAFCVVGTASAQGRDFRLGARIGYAVSSGKSGDDASGQISDYVAGQLPIGIDVGYMVTPNMSLGVYWQYGFGIVHHCDVGAACSAHDMRLDLQGEYYFNPGGIDPWLGVGIGYEWLGVSESGAVDGNTINLDGNVHGLELFNLQTGVDFPMADAFTVGPFLSFSLDQFSGVTINGQSGTIENPSLHEWFAFGARGTFTL